MAIATIKFYVNGGTIYEEGTPCSEENFSLDRTSPYAPEENTQFTAMLGSGFRMRTASISFSRDGYVFKEWNTNSDGTGQSVTPGELVEQTSSLYAIWLLPEVIYTVTDNELILIADAIRTKGGTSAQLAFPAGFVSAIEDIQAGGGSATEYVLQATSLPVEGRGYDFTSAGLTASDFDRNSTTKMWLEATTTFQANVYLDQDADDEFPITIPSGTFFECVSCQDGQSWKSALFAFAIGTTAAYGFIVVEYDKSLDCARIAASGGDPSYGSAVQMPGFKKQNGGLPLVDSPNLELHILKY